MLTFFRQFLTNHYHTGAIVPSSSRLARVMTRTLREGSGPRKVMEVGPGTGPVTRKVLDALQPGDSFDVVEVNPVFCEALEEKLLAPFRKEHADITVRLHEASIEDADVQGPFDYIVCGVPFNNFDPQLMRAIFRRMLNLLGDDGLLTYYEYPGMREIKAPFVDAEGRRKVKQREATRQVLRRRYHGRRELVVGNIPPAWAISLSHS